MAACQKCQTELPAGARFCSNCGAESRPADKPAAAATEIVPGQTVVAGRYRVEAMLGSGGMGAVYKCSDLALGETVALKFLHSAFANDPKMIERFTHEIKVVRRIQHKSVVPNYDIGEWQGMHYIVMAFVDGRALSDILVEKKRLSLEEMLPIATQVISGLKAAHDEGIVHRDLKTDNILVDSKGNAFILDFGIARRVDSIRLTVTGEVLGSPLYISPEQAQGQDVDHRADIYSFGVILFELLTGEVPYGGDDALAVALKHVMSPLVSPRSLRPELPDYVEKVILRCMQKMPADRYADVTQILPDLLRISTTMPALPKSEAPPPTAPRASASAPAPAQAPSSGAADAAPPPALAPAAPPALRAVRPEGQRRLLVIDTDQGQLLSLRRDLTKVNIQVISASNGQAGAEMAFAQNPDAIVINARAPVIDGITFSQILRSRPEFQSTPIFLLCDRPDPSYAALQKQLRISGFVLRPIEGQDLLLRLKEVWADGVN
jgi:serine/threonine protein kinase